MSKTFFTSDLHFGHNNIIRYDNRPFSSIEEMDLELIKRWNNKVSKCDTVYILGDISWYNDEKTFEIFSQLNGSKRLIKGNHDRTNGKIKNLFESIKDYDEIKINDTTLILSHYPIHMYNHHYHGAIMLYGHVHNSKENELVQQFATQLNNIYDCPVNMINVGCMNCNYEPMTLEELLLDGNNNTKR